MSGVNKFLSRLVSAGHAVAAVSAGRRRGPLSGAVAVGAAASAAVFFTAATGVAGTVSAWSIAPSPNVLARQGELAGVSCPGAENCVAVGHYISRGGMTVPLAKSWDGVTWTREYAPRPSGARSSALGAVSCLSSRLCTAVGAYTDSTGRQRPLAERWNGLKWAIQPTPGYGSLAAVSCTSSWACMAVGTRESSGGTGIMRAERWNGSLWSVVRVPPTLNNDDHLAGVSCRSARWCTAVGYSFQGDLKGIPVVEHWNGSTWVQQRTPLPADQYFWSLESVSCTSVSACTAVGDRSNVDFDYARPLVMRWNGSYWARQHMPGAGTDFTIMNGTSCASATACTAVGYASDSSLTTSAPVTERWDGTAWAVQASPPAAGFLAGVSCSSASACVAVGALSSSPHVSLAERWDGSAWTVLPSSGDPVGATDSSLAAVSCLPGTVCAAVGSGNNQALAEAWNGTAWVIQPAPTPAGAANARLTGVSCTSATSCMAVGSYTDGNGAENGLTEIWDGTAWSIQPAAAGTQALSGVSCTSATACTAVGQGSSGPVAEQWDGTAWTVQPLAAGAAVLSAVSCTSPTACTAVGLADSGQPAAERWDGTAWNLEQVPGLEPLQGVSCASGQQCMAVGQRGIAVLWDGQAWTTQALPQPHGDLLSVSCTSVTACTAAGRYDTSSGTMMLVDHWDGTTWSFQATPSPLNSQSSSFAGVSCTSGQACAAVGRYFRSTDLTLVESRS